MIASVEQARFFSVKSGFYIGVANAGTGKTTTCSEFIAIRICEEMDALGGSSPGNFAKVIKQFHAVTFTRKAAAELDEKIKARLSARAIPYNDWYGQRPLRIARTLDSLLQNWLRHPMLIQPWLKLYPSHTRTLKEIRQLSGVTLSDNELAKAWSWLLDEQIAAFIWQVIVFLPGITMNHLLDSWRAFITSGVPTAEALKEWWMKERAGGQKVVAEMHQLSTMIAAGSLPDHEVSTAQKRVDDFKLAQRRAAELASCYNVAASRGNFLDQPEILQHPDVLMAIASCESIPDLDFFLDSSHAFEQIKQRCGLLEFNDILMEIVHTLQKNTFLLEPNREYPRFGFRRKYLVWDEAQDNSPYQFHTLRLLVGRAANTSIVVGDGKQSIYAFRGASPRQFFRGIEKLTQKDPTRLLSLSCSYRSAKAIVALGNEVARILPSYGAGTIDSSGISQEEGAVVCAPPHYCVEDEASWLKQTISWILQERPEDTIMCLARSNLATHPAYQWIKGLGSRVQFLTIHGAKGLEADHVFLLGLCAGEFPDARGDEDQEANLFYVAVTRAKLVLYLSTTELVTKMNSEGYQESKYAGPSPYYLRIPILTALAHSVGWTQEMLEAGQSTHETLRKQFLARVLKRVENFKNSASNMLQYKQDGEPSRIEINR